MEPQRLLEIKERAKTKVKAKTKILAKGKQRAKTKGKARASQTAKTKAITRAGLLTLLPTTSAEKVDCKSDPLVAPVNFF